MGGIMYLLGIIGVIVIYPYIRCFFKRLNCFIKVKRFCKNKNYALVGTHCFWIFGRKNDNVCDFYVETKEDVYAVKLFAMLRRRTMLIFREDRTYFIRKFLGLYGQVLYVNPSKNMIAVYLGADRLKDFDILFEQLSTYLN